VLNHRAIASNLRTIASRILFVDTENSKIPLSRHEQPFLRPNGNDFLLGQIPREIEEAVPDIDGGLI
jgi:hypothetical protein